MDDEQILGKGGDSRDIKEYAKQNGADLTKEDFTTPTDKQTQEGGEMKNKYVGYGLKNGNILLYKFFNLRREAVEYAKYSVSNHKNIDYRDCYKILKVELKELWPPTTKLLTQERCNDDK